jgi:hypothetical protein
LVGLELTEQTPSWRPTYALRGLASLPVTLESVRRSSLPAD